MKRIKAIAAGAVLAATAGSALLLTASPASAAAPGWEPDPNGNGGTISFYDASGNQISGGNNLAHLFDYAVASSPEDPAGFKKASIAFAFPNHLQPTSAWFVQNASASTTYPVTSGPASITSIDPSIPVAHPGSSDANLTAALGAGALDTTAGYANIMQIRLTQSGGTAYYTADISYDTAAGTWQQVYPVLAPATATTTTLSVSPSSPQTTGTNVTLTANVAAATGPAPTTGSVQFFDGATQIGGTQPFTGAAVSVSTSTLSVGTHSLTAKYVPSGITFGGSTSAATSYKINGIAVNTTTVLSGPTTTTYGTAVTIHADVKDAASAALPAGAGSVQFKVDGTNVGGPVSLTATGADFSFNPAGAGTNTITATFTPADPTAYNPSADTTGVTVVTSAPAYNPSPANLTVTVPQGTLVISTPYTVQNPFKLGTMTLNAQGTLYSASAPFGDPAAPAATDPGSLGTTAISGTYPAAKTANGVTITDTRAGSTGWTASAQVTDFTNPGLTTLIPGDNLTFSNITPKYLPGNALQSGDVTTPAGTLTGLKTTKQAFATAAKGPGTVNITGVLGLTAVTSTLPGDYTATLTFTIV